MLQQDGPQRTLAARVLSSIGSAGQLDEALLPRVLQRLRALRRIEPKWLLATTALDLPCELVGNDAALLDLAPHARGDLQLLRELRRQAERFRPIGRTLRNEVAEEDQDIMATNGRQGHAWSGGAKRPCERTWSEKKTQHPKKVLRRAVNPVYITSIDEIDSSSFFRNHLRFIENSPTTGTIVNANLSSLNHRPASGRTFVRVLFCGGSNLTTFKMHSQLNSFPAIPASLWLGQQYEDQPHPGGGSA